jgi:hypothetical protein
MLTAAVVNERIFDQATAQSVFAGADEVLLSLDAFDCSKWGLF